MGTGVVLRDKMGKLLLVKASYRDYWSLPGGVVDKDESPRETGRREVFEELGLEVKQLKLLVVNYNQASGDADESVQWIFDGGVLTEKQTAGIKVDGDEIVECRWVSFKEAVELSDQRVAKKLNQFEKVLEEQWPGYLEDWDEV